MRTFFLNNLLIIILGLAISLDIEAQGRFSAYIDAGENNVSEGLYIKTSLFGAYQPGKTEIECGTQFDIKSAGSNFLTGLSLSGTREFQVKAFQFEIQGLFMFNPFSDLVHESDLGILANVERKHFAFKLGTEFRTFHITKKASEEFDIVSNKNLNENWNIMYLLGYNLKPIDNDWNCGIVITNIDHFLINQEINPLIYLHGKCNVSSPLTIYIESWYKSAGSLNINATYFGFFIRTGMIWEPGLKK